MPLGTVKTRIRDGVQRLRAFIGRARAMAPEPVHGVDEHEIDDAALEALAEAYASRRRRAPAGTRARRRRRDRESRARKPSSAGRARSARSLAGVALAFAGLFAREVQLGRERAHEIGAVAVRTSSSTHEIASVAAQNATTRRPDSTNRVERSQGYGRRSTRRPRCCASSVARASSRRRSRLRRGVVGAGRVLVDATTGETARSCSRGSLRPRAGKTYELWAIRGKKAPEPAGLDHRRRRRRCRPCTCPKRPAPGGGHGVRGVDRAAGRLAVADRPDRSGRRRRELSALTAEKRWSRRGRRRSARHRGTSRRVGRASEELADGAFQRAGTEAVDDAHRVGARRSGRDRGNRSSRSSASRTRSPRC